MGEHLKPKKDFRNVPHVYEYLADLFFCRYTFYRTRWLHNLPVEEI